MLTAFAFFLFGGLLALINLNPQSHAPQGAIFRSTYVKNLANVSGLGFGVTHETTTVVTRQLSTITSTGMISYCSPDHSQW